MEAASHRAQREAREQGRKSFSLGAVPRTVLRVLVECYGMSIVRGWVDDLGREADEDE